MERITDFSFTQFFTATAWDVYFANKDHYPFKGNSVSDIASLIKDDIGFIIEQQGFTVPDITDMVRDLKVASLRTDGTNEDKKNEFVNKYSEILSARIQNNKIINK